MGELLRKIGTIDVNNCRFDVELNAPPACGSGRSVHIQNKLFRLEISEEDFFRMAGAVLESYRQFQWIKGESMQKKDRMMEENNEQSRGN